MFAINGKHPTAPASVGKLRQFITIKYRRGANRGQIAGCHCVFQPCPIQRHFNQVIGGTARFHCIGGSWNPGHILAVTDTAIAKINTVFGKGRANQAEGNLNRACRHFFDLRCECGILKSSCICSLLGFFLYRSSCGFCFRVTAAAALLTGSGASLVVTAPSISGSAPGVVRNRYATITKLNSYLVQIRIVGLKLGKLNGNLIAGLAGILNFEGQGTHHTVANDTGGQGFIPGIVNIAVLGIADGATHNRAVLCGNKFQLCGIISAL